MATFSSYHVRSLGITEAALAEPVYNVLFLCTGNSARSILAEAILNRAGEGRFRTYSAGSHPKGWIHPAVLTFLKQMNFPVDGLRSKSWDEFAAPGAPVMDFVFSVCDDAAKEICPHWPGQPMSAHWGLPDPAEITGNAAAQIRAIAFTYQMLRTRITILTNLPLASLDRVRLQRQLDEIGETPPPASN